jgi:hypothetical protein
MSKTKPIVDASSNLSFDINSNHVKEAKPMCKRECVIAQALKGYPELHEVEVGASKTFLHFATKIVRYKTPTVLRDALRAFDATGDWKLKKGTRCRLLAPSPAETLERQRVRQEATKNRRKAGTVAACKRRTMNPRYIAALKAR